MSPIKYRYALSPSGRSISIDQIDPKSRKEYGELTCFGCGSELLPRLGPKNVNHFYHRSDGKGCGSETYLHNMTKTRIYEILTERRNLGLKVDVELPWQQRKIFVDADGIEFNKNARPKLVPKSYEILNASTELYLEKRVKQFVPDVFAKNSEGLDIFIEVYVTHPCSDEKIYSGMPIIELKIESQETAEVVFKQINNGRLEGVIFGSPNTLLKGINFPIDEVKIVSQELADNYRKRIENAARFHEMYSKEHSLSSPPETVNQYINPGFRTAVDYGPDTRTDEEKARDARVCKAIAEGMRTAREAAASRETEALRYDRY